MKETEVKIPLADAGLNIYGILRGDYSKPVVILCHGYGGWMNEMLLYNGARALGKQGFTTLRLSMYGGGDKSRDIKDSDLMTHASDIDTVVDYAKQAGAGWVGVVGHSFSGLAIVYSQQQQFDAAVLWDPTHTDAYKTDQAKQSLKTDFVFVDELNAYVSGRGSGDVYAKTVFDNDYPTSQAASRQFRVPTCVINASWSKEQQAYGQDYANTIDAETKHIVIPDSSHPFTEDGAAEKLFKATAEYFAKMKP